MAYPDNKNFDDLFWNQWSEFKIIFSGSYVFWQIKFLLAVFVDGNLVIISAKLFSILTTGFRGEDF